MLRNRELGQLVAICLGMVAVVCALVVLLGGGRGAVLGVLAGAACVAVPCAVYTRRRYRDLAHLSDRVDAVLHGERALDLDHMREGELAVLSSELDKMVTRLNLTADELSRESRSLADSLADVSHQLKTPMTSLSIMCELVRKRVLDHAESFTREDADDVLMRIRTMQRLLDRVQWLVAALLKLARIDAGVVTLARMPVDVSQLVANAASSLAIAFDLAGVRLDIDVPEGISFDGDPAWSAEALGNIMKNCMEHTGEGGTVRVRASEDALMCKIVVTDTGTGISDDDLPHIFERFYRGSAATTASCAGAVSQVNPAGVGIGLSLAQSLVSAQGGTIRASNVKDPDGYAIGARFEIIFFKSVV